MKIIDAIQFCVAIAIGISFAAQTSAQSLPVVVAKRDLPAGTVINELNVQVAKMSPDKIPGSSFAELEQVLGQQVIQKIFANNPVLKTQLAPVEKPEPPANVGASETLSSPQETRIVAIPVGISTRYRVGELVRLVNKADGQRKTIADNLKVFHIGEPDTITGENNQQIFIRFVSVLAPIQTVETITNSLDSDSGAYVLEKLDPDSGNLTNNGVASTTTQFPTTTPRQIPSQPRVIVPNPKTYPGQLRQMARLLESQAAELEDQGNYQQADLIRDACQSLREAARVK